MRLSISEILGLTAIVAVYAAGLGLLAQEGLLDRIMAVRFPAMLPLMAFVAFLAVRLLKSYSEIGGVITVFTVPRLMLWRLGCVGVFVAAATLCYANRSQFQLMYLIAPIMVQVGREFGGRIAFGDLGMAAMGYSLLWSEYWFALDAIEDRLHAVPRVGARPGGWLAARSFRLPKERVQAVSAILAAKQESSVQTRVDADS